MTLADLLKTLNSEEHITLFWSDFRDGKDMDEETIYIGDAENLLKEPIEEPRSDRSMGSAEILGANVLTVSVLTDLDQESLIQFTGYPNRGEKMIGMTISLGISLLASGSPNP